MISTVLEKHSETKRYWTMDFKEDEKKLMRRRHSEPPLSGRLTSSSRQSNSSVHSLQESIPSQHMKLSWHKTSSPDRKVPVVRSSTFPLLPTFNNKVKSNPTFFKGHENHEPLPFFSNMAFNNREFTPNQRGGTQEARKFHLRSRYTIDAVKAPAPKELPSNPLRKRVQDINDNYNKIIGNANILPESDDLLPDCYTPYSEQQTSIRRLSTITEKSNFSRATKTAIFDLEEENDINKGILPSVDRNPLNSKKQSYLENNCRKLQEHVTMTERQFDPLESKASLLTNWFKTLETEG